MADPAALGFQRRADRVRLANTTRRLASREWRKVDADNIRASYGAVWPRLIALLGTAQERAASGADTYLERVVAAQGGSTQDVAVNAAAWRNSASDGRPLADLLRVPAWWSVNALANGATPLQALAYGGTVLDRIMGTQVVDAGRTADGVVITASRVSGYERIAAPPCCARCAILGGQVYRWSTGFERHPYCDCFHVPVISSYEKRIGSDPMELFRNGQIRGMSQADIKSVKDGADLNQVVNARRGMSTAAGRKVSWEGTSKRGFAGTRLGGGIPRLMPEQIYKDAAGDRQQAIALLRANGYLR